MKMRATNKNYISGAGAALLLLTAVLTLPAHAQDADAPWSDKFNITGLHSGAGTSGILTALDAHDGIYIGGTFEYINGIEATSIAFWDGTTWKMLGKGLKNSGEPGVVYSLLADGDKLYAGGRFDYAGETQTSGLAVWNKASGSWSAVGSEGDPGADGNINSIIKHNNKIYVAGDFGEINGVTASNIAMWDGNTWAEVGGGINGEVHSIKQIDGKIYAVGNFSQAGAQPAENMAVFDGTDWEEFAGGSDGAVVAIEAVGNAILVGGEFSQLDGENISYLGEWDGTQWKKISPGPTGEVTKIRAANNGYIVSGHFTGIGIDDAPGLAFRENNAWVIPEFELSPPFFIPIPVVFDAVPYKNGHILAGAFYKADGIIFNNIAYLTADKEIEPFHPAASSQGITGAIGRITAHGDAVYAAGEFLAPAIPEDGLGFAKWNGTAWEAPLTDLGFTADPLYSEGDNLYVGGHFEINDGTEVSGIAVYNSSEDIWSTMGDGINGDVYAVVKYGNKIYAGGQFDSVNGNAGDAARNVAVWDGSKWSALSSGAGTSSDWINSLVIYKGQLIAAGKFNELGNIAAWDGVSWNILGDGVNGLVNNLIVGDDTLYIAGEFTSAGSSNANTYYIAAWDGSDWSAVGDGFDDTVYALAYKEGVLYAGGAFNNSGLEERSKVAAWDGAEWHSLGSGITDYSSVGYSEVYSLAITPGNELYVAGFFAKAGGKPSFGIAAYDLTQSPVSVTEESAERITRYSLEQNYPNPFNPATNISYSVPNRGTVSLKVFNMLGQEVATLVNGVKTAGSHTVSFDASKLASGMYIYRLTAGGATITKKMMLIK